MKATLNSHSSSCVLIVDDSKVSRMFVARILEENGIKHLLYAADGEEALEITQRFKPDLVICDLVMPKLDGFGYCEQIRCFPEFARMPIIIQTAMTEPEKRAEAFHSGATDLLLKPLNKEELVARVDIHLQNRTLLTALQKYAERVDNELKSARDMQSDILPSEEEILAVSDLMPVKIASHFEGSTELSGDFWGCAPLSGNKLAVYTVDFTGHGVKAALNTFRLHTLMQSEFYPIDKPAEYLSKLNERLYQLLPPEHFATMFYGVIDFNTDELRYATAATTSPIMLQHKQARDNGKCIEVIDGSGLPLSVKSDAEYTEKSIPFKPGDMLFCYSDVLIESEKTDGEYLCDQDMIDFCEKYAKEASEEYYTPLAFSASLVDYFFEETGARPPDDDLTIVAISRL